MIPDSLLFQVSPISFVSYHSFFWLIACFLFAFFSALYFHRFITRKTQKTIPQNLEKIHFPDISDTDFEVKLALLLRQKIAQKYPPYPSFAHTSDDISLYVREDDIREIIKILETAEYTGNRIPLEKRKEMIQSIRIFSGE